MINIDVSGLDELEAILKKNEIDLKAFRAVLFNNSSLAKVFEYGSIPGIYPWHSADEDTTEISDIETGAKRIVSKSGFAALRGNEKKALAFFHNLLDNIDLTESIENQIIAMANQTIRYWKKLAVEDTPDGKGAIKKAWDIKEAY